jgi:hypothetical protein
VFVDVAASDIVDFDRRRKRERRRRRRKKKMGLM